MAALTLIYDDGRRETVTVRPVALVAAERRFGENMPRIEGSLFAAWFTLGKPADSFDDWLGSISDMEGSVNGEAAPRPLAEGQPPEQ